MSSISGVPLPAAKADIEAFLQGCEKHYNNREPVRVVMLVIGKQFAKFVVHDSGSDYKIATIDCVSSYLNDLLMHGKGERTKKGNSYVGKDWEPRRFQWRNSQQ